MEVGDEIKIHPRRLAFTRFGLFTLPVAVSLKIPSVYPPQLRPLHAALDHDLEIRR